MILAMHAHLMDKTQLQHRCFIWGFNLAQWGMKVRQHTPSSKWYMKRKKPQMENKGRMKQTVSIFNPQLLLPSNDVTSFCFENDELIL